jgi:hypothetical protein
MPEPTVETLAASVARLEEQIKELHLDRKEQVKLNLQLVTLLKATLFQPKHLTDHMISDLPNQSRVLEKRQPYRPESS